MTIIGISRSRLKLGQFIGIIIYFFGSLGPAAPLCSQLFQNRTRLEGLSTHLETLRKNSPSKMIPVFRLIHDSFADHTNDGLAYLHLANSEWKKPEGGSIKVVSQQATTGSPESVVIFRGKPSTKESSIEAKQAIRGDTYGFNDRPRVFGDATNIRIRVSSANPETTHVLRIGSEQPFDFHFKASREPKDLVIPIPKNDNEYDKGTFGTAISLRWPKEQPAFELKIYGPIVFERNASIEESYARAHILNYHYENDFYDGRIPFVQLRADHSALLKTAIKNLFTKEKLEIALSFAQEGENAIVHELQRMGAGSLVFLNDKIEVQQFFAKRMRRTSFDNPVKVPVETGEFATEHGAFSHGLQIIAMTRGMSDIQARAFLFGPYDGIFNRETERWRTWDSLFDSPGDSLPTSPLWWRKQLEIRETTP